MTGTNIYSTRWQYPKSSPEWRTFEAVPRVEAGFASRGSADEVPGISFVHLADQCTVTAGDRVIFTAWVLNATAETLRDVSLKVHSFTNSGLDPIEYETQPPQKLLNSRVVGPRQSLQYVFSYVLKPSDIQEPGQLISALYVEATSETHGRLYSECDSFVTIRQ